MQHSIMQNSAVECYRGNDIWYVTLYNNGPMLQHLWYYKVLQDIIECSGAHPKITDGFVSPLTLSLDEIMHKRSTTHA